LEETQPEVSSQPASARAALSSTAVRKPRTRKVTQQQAEEAPASIKAPLPAAITGVPYEHSKEFQQYQSNAQDLKDFVDQHGRYPTRTTSADIAEIKLAWWYQDQKKSFNKGTLLPLKEQCLNDTLGSTDWQQNSNRLRLDVDDMVRLVKKWVAEHDGQLPPYKAFDEDGVNLGLWVHNRRGEYREGKLEPEYIEVLEAIPGWHWKVRGRVSFEEGLEVLEAYGQEHGMMPSSGTKGNREGFNLGRWVRMQRENKRAGKLSAEKVKALEQVEGWYWGAF
jgi:hypothetical protein